MNRPRVGTVLAVVAVAGMIGLWTYLFVLADPEVPDELDDPSYGTAAQEVCAAARGRIDALPPAQEAGSPEERAETLVEANEILRGMVDELTGLAPTEGEDARLVGLWLDDWRTYVADRVEYADALAAGEDAELLVTAREEGGGQITETIDHFARINQMPDCQVPLDV